MKFQIEEYKGFEIVYNDDSDRFECSMELNDNVKNSKRGSLADMRKEIDQFIKANSEFKPFWFLLKSSYGNGFARRYCSAVRTDGKMVSKSSETDARFSILDEKEMKLVCFYDVELIEALNRAYLDREAAQAKYRSVESDLTEKLVPLDLSKYGI